MGRIGFLKRTAITKVRNDKKEKKPNNEPLAFKTILFKAQGFPNTRSGRQKDPNVPPPHLISQDISICEGRQKTI